MPPTPHRRRAAEESEFGYLVGEGAHALTLEAPTTWLINVTQGGICRCTALHQTTRLVLRETRASWRMRRTH